MVVKRKTGWYFVKFEKPESWRIAFYDSEWNGWCFCGSEFSFETKQLYEIGDMVEVPEKYKDK
jgi:hypothetical protein